MPRSLPRRYSADHLSIIRGVAADRRRTGEQTGMLVHADYLEEHGYQALPEFVRRSVALDNPADKTWDAADQMDSTRPAVLTLRYPRAGKELETELHVKRGADGRVWAQLEPLAHYDAPQHSYQTVSNRLVTRDADLIRRLVAEAEPADEGSYGADLRDRWEGYMADLGQQRYARERHLPRRVLRYARERIPVATMHPELRFTRLGAVLREHAANSDDPAAAMAHAALTSPHDQPLELMPLLAMRDYVQENPGHPLATRFNWEKLPEKVALDRDMYDHLQGGANSAAIIRGSHGRESGLYGDEYWHTNNAYNAMKFDGGHEWVTPDDVAQSASRMAAKREREATARYTQRRAENEPGYVNDYPESWHAQQFNSAAPHQEPQLRSNHPERYARPGRPVAFAKAETGRTPAHPTVQGFPLELALRRLANDPKNTGDVRDLAKLALTGGGYSTTKDDAGNKVVHWHHPEGKSEALWLLHDALRESGHPAADHFNWLSAADSLGLDRHTHRALEEAAAHTRATTPGSHHLGDDPRNGYQWRFTPEDHAVRAGLGMNAARDRGRVGAGADAALLARVRARVGQLAPLATPGQIDASVRRHVVRAQHLYRATHGLGTEADRARAMAGYVRPHPPEGQMSDWADANEKAARYRRLAARLRLARAGRARRYASPGNPDVFPVEKMAGWLQFTPLGAILRQYAGRAMHAAPPPGKTPQTWVPTLAHDLLSTGEWGALTKLADHMTANPDHPLAKLFDWHKVPEEISRDADLRDVIDNSDRRHRASYPDPAALFPIRSGDVVRHFEPGMSKNGMTGWVVKHMAALREKYPAATDEDWRRSAARIHRAKRGISGPLANSPAGAAAAHDQMALDHINAHRPATKLRRRYAANRSDFLGALRQIRASNQVALKKSAEDIAAKLGLAPAVTLDALHDTPGGSVPGVVQAVYGQAAPEQVHAAAAWLGLLANSPGVAVFHPRPGGDSTLYRFRQAGGGHEIREKLDRAGITTRVLIPHRTGFDVVIADRGNRLGRAVRGYARQHGVEVQASPGFLKRIGSQDQAQARAQFRDTVAGAERMRRAGRPAKYAGGDRAALVRSVLANPIETTPRKVLADWLDEFEPASAGLAEHLRHHEGPIQASGDHIHYPGERVVTVARDGARTAGRYPLFATAEYTATRRGRDGLLTWRRTGTVGRATSGYAPTRPMVEAAKRHAANAGLRYADGIRHGMPAGRLIQPAPTPAPTPAVHPDEIDHNATRLPRLRALLSRRGRPAAR